MSPLRPVPNTLHAPNLDIENRSALLQLHMLLRPCASELIVCSTKWNARESPFLKLPPEIRNRIYSFALGGYHIHIDYKEPSSRYRRINFVTRKVPIPGGFYNRTLRMHGGVNDDLPKNHHLADRAPLPKNEFTLGLLCTCRQVYREACLLPYELNAFSFYSASVFLKKFMPSLKPCQKRAINSLFDNFEDAPSWGKQLTGLKTVYVPYRSKNCDEKPEEWSGKWSGISILCVKVVIPT